MAQARITIERTRAGRSAQNLILVGQPMRVSGALQGIAALAGKLGVVVVYADAATGASLPALLSPSLPALLSPALATALHALKSYEQSRALVERTERGLVGFTAALQPRFPDLARLDGQSEAGLADNGNLEFDLAALLESAGRAAGGA